MIKSISQTKGFGGLPPPPQSPIRMRMLLDIVQIPFETTTVKI